MDNELEVIRDQMDETRASLADKLETLEAQVRETVQTATATVQSATETVTSTVENVKETVASTVENVKDTVSSTVDTVKGAVDSVASRLDPRPYVQEYPWTSVGVAVGVGFVGGLLTGGTPSGRRAWPASMQEAQARAPSPPPAPASYAAPQPQRPGVLSSLLNPAGPFGEVVDKLKGLAIGTLLGYVREMVSTSAPEMWRNDLTGMVDNITTELGGKVIHHPDLACHRAGDGSAGHPSHSDGGRSGLG